MYGAERRAQAALIRCIVGNPFRPVVINPRWLTPMAVGLANSMYDARDFTAAPILADALESAGCDAPELLAHLRGPGPHVRGCWAVDLVLGRGEGSVRVCPSRPPLQIGCGRPVSGAGGCGAVTWPVTIRAR